MPNKATGTHARLWYTEVGPLTAWATDTLVSRLPLPQQARYKHFSSPKRRAEYLLSRTLIFQALNDYFENNTHHWQLEEIPHKALSLTHPPFPCYLTLSHSHNMMCFAISNRPIGIDIERVKPKSSMAESAAMFMSLQEQDKLNAFSAKPDQLAYFYRLWCTKEAIYKALPTQFQNNTCFPELSATGHKKDEKLFDIFNLRLSQYHLSVANQTPSNFNEENIVYTDLLADLVK